jgi:hypothetical protein
LACNYLFFGFNYLCFGFNYLCFIFNDLCFGFNYRSFGFNYQLFVFRNPFFCFHILKDGAKPPAVPAERREAVAGCRQGWLPRTELADFVDQQWGLPHLLRLPMVFPSFSPCLFEMYRVSQGRIAYGLSPCAHTPYPVWPAMDNRRRRHNRATGDGLSVRQKT